MSLLDEVADHEGVLEDITRCEALVGLPGSQPLLSVEAWVMGLRESRRTMSKKGKCFFSLTISLSSFHCASVGSIPVGFWEASANHTRRTRTLLTWAQACSSICEHYDKLGGAYRWETYDRSLWCGL